MRDAFGVALLQQSAEAGFVALDADNCRSTRVDSFAERFPDRFLNVGCAEQNLIGVAAGIAAAGVPAIASTFSVFLCGRAFEQIRNSVCQGGLDVTLVGTHAGVTVGLDGPSHFAIEDLALMRSLPGMRVAVASSDEQVAGLLRLCIEHPGPAYLRLSRRSCPLGRDRDEVRWGGADVLHEGSDVSVFATGEMVKPALEAAEILGREGVGVEVLDVYSVKPLPEAPIEKSAAKTGATVVAEEHSLFGGLGEGVAGLLGRTRPIPIEHLAIDDTFGFSGPPDKLIEALHLGVDDLIAAIRRAMDRRNDSLDQASSVSRPLR